MSAPSAAAAPWWAATPWCAAAQQVREKILVVAARELEAHPADLELRDGAVHVRGVADRALPLREIARAASVTRALATGIEPGLEALDYYAQDKMTYGHGLHLAVVEVDAETGCPRILRYAIAYDVGRAINPMLVEGQIVGGLAQGLGAALHEELVYDDDGSARGGDADGVPPPGGRGHAAARAVGARGRSSPDQPAGRQGRR